MEFHLAQVNIARMRAPLEDPLMAGFTSRIEAINALADASPGFVWRLHSEAGDATYLRPYQDQSILFNLSVWQSLDALKQYVYNSEHLALLKAKTQWFSKLDRPHLALWWVAQGHLPTVDEALQRLDWIQTRGPSPQAFSFARAYPHPTTLSDR